MVETGQPVAFRVVSDYRAAYPDPIVVRAGDEVAVQERESEWAGWTWCTAPSGKSGWVPDRYLDRHGDTAAVLHDYRAAELTVSAGETVTAGAHEAGWRWCTNADGESGWVPDGVLGSPAGSAT